MYNNVLFVNKDSQSFKKKRTQQEARAINEHVNGTYARYQREQKAKTSRHAPVKLPSSRHSGDHQVSQTSCLIYGNRTNQKQEPTGR